MKDYTKVGYVYSTESNSANEAVFIKLGDSRLHPTVGATSERVMVGVGYEFKNNWNIDIGFDKRWDMTGKPGKYAGASYTIRF